MSQIRFWSLAAFFALAAFAAATAQNVPPQLEGERYVVVRGDTLWDVAEMIYGDPFQWPKIWEANKDVIPNPHLISPQQLLQLTDKQGRPLIVRATPKEESKKAEPPKAPPQENFPEEKEEEMEVGIEMTKTPQAPPASGKQQEEEEWLQKTAELVPAGRTVPKPEFQEYDGRIIAAKDSDKNLLGQGDIIFVDLGEYDGLVPGDELLIVRKLRRVTSRRTSSQFWVFEQRGRLRVTPEIYEKRSACKILFSHMPVSIGDGVMRVARP